VIGGLLIATVATLFFVPTVFSMLHSQRARPHAAPDILQPEPIA
jgi:Cu/Ag efflux pump CusA